jgi:hypothetical protein
MFRSTPRLCAPVLAMLAAFSANSALALPHESHHAAVKACHFLGNVHGSSGHGKHHDWKSLAKRRALVKAKKLGATNVVWHRIRQTGSFNGVADGKAYACKSHAAPPSHH